MRPRARQAPSAEVMGTVSTATRSSGSSFGLDGMKPRRVSETAARDHSVSASASPEDLSSHSQHSAATTDSSTTRPTKTRRTVLTSNACLRCRQRKTKCDGKHPICIRCHRDGAQCQYDVAREGLTKMQNLQQQLQARDREIATTTRLLNMLQTSTDQHATELLARLRLGESVDEIVGRFDDAPEASSSNNPTDEQAAVSETTDQSAAWWSAPLSPLTDEMTASLHFDSNMTGAADDRDDQPNVTQGLPHEPLQSSSAMNIDPNLSSEYPMAAPWQHLTQQVPQQPNTNVTSVTSSSDQQATRRTSVHSPPEEGSRHKKPRQMESKPPPARRTTNPDLLQMPPPSTPAKSSAPRGMKPFWSGRSPLDAPEKKDDPDNDNSTSRNQWPR